MNVKAFISTIVICLFLVGIEARAEINHGEADGENGYYKEAPEIVLKHTGEGIMRYRLEDGNGKTLTGRLDSSMRTLTIQKRILKDGENILDTWLEDQEGNIIEESMERRRFLVDQIPPESPLSFVLNDVLEIGAKDVTSGVEGIYYALEGETFQYVKGDRVFLTLPENYEGIVRAFAVDTAGNRGEESTYLIEKKEEPIVQKPKPEETLIKDDKPPVIVLAGLPEEGITKSAVDIVCSVTDEQKIVCLKGTILHKNQEEKEELWEITEWKKEKEGYQFKRGLEEDGIYQIRIEVTDEAGNLQEMSKQLILDSSGPVLSRIQELEDKAISEFVWKYDAEDFIQDLTSVTYEARLDGILCKKNHVYKEPGTHLLEVTARDLTGNVSKETAKFVIVPSEKEAAVEVGEKAEVVRENVSEEKPIVSELKKLPPEQDNVDIISILIGCVAAVLLIGILIIVVKKKRELQN